jgi:CDP-4-dehydro-6-deoxyglucose reductase
MTAKKNQDKKLTCKIQSIEYLTHDVAQVFLKIQKNELLQYFAGQHIELIHPDFSSRSFSVANYTSTNIGLLELHVRLIDGGKFTQMLCGELRENLRLQIDGPKGNCYLKQGSTKSVILVAGSTGFGPIKSIIEYVIETGVDRQIYIYWGVREEVDLYMNLPQQWATEYDNIHYIPVLSDSNDVAWKGRTGLVHRSVVNDFDVLTDHEVYAFGPPAMVKSLARTLADKGLVQEDFSSDFPEFNFYFDLSENSAHGIMIDGELCK